MGTLFDVRLLNNFDAKTYLGVLKALALADGSLSSEEEAFIADNAKLLGVDCSEILPCKYLSDSVLLSMSSLTKKIIIRDAIVLAYRDGSFSLEEKKAILDLASTFGVDKDFVYVMDQWLLSYWKIVAQGLELVSN